MYKSSPAQIQRESFIRSALTDSTTGRVSSKRLGILVILMLLVFVCVTTIFILIYAVSKDRNVDTDIIEYILSTLSLLLTGLYGIVQAGRNVTEFINGKGKERETKQEM